MLRTCSVVPFFRRNCSHAQAWCKFSEVELPKVLRLCRFLMIFTSKSLSRAGVVQILASSTSKTFPSMPILTILISESLSRTGVVQILSTSCSRSFAPPRFSDLPLRTSKPRTYGKTQYTAKFLPTKISLVSYLRGKKYLCYPILIL